MEERTETQLKEKSFWHYLRYNPPSLLGLWFEHMKSPDQTFWVYLNWNSPWFEHWMSQPTPED